MIENHDLKYTRSLKVLTFPKNHSEILLRLTNLEDRFNPVADTYHFDVNTWAREMYLEANSHLAYNNTFDVLKHLKIIITEMNLSGVVSKDYIKHVQN